MKRNFYPSWKQFHKFVLVIALGLFGVGAEAPAAGDNSVDVPRSPHSKLRQVQGTIVRKKKVELRGRNAHNLVVTLRSRKEGALVPIDLGPEADLKELSLDKGASLAVEGRVKTIRYRPFLVATRVKQGTTMVPVRRPAQRADENAFFEAQRKAAASAE